MAILPAAVNLQMTDRDYRPGRADGCRRAPDLDALGAFDLPEGEGGLLGQGGLDGIARGQGLEDAVHLLAKDLGVLIGQDGDASSHTMLESVHA